MLALMQPNQTIQLSEIAADFGLFFVMREEGRKLLNIRSKNVFNRIACSDICQISSGPISLEIKI